MMSIAIRNRYKWRPTNGAIELAVVERTVWRNGHSVAPPRHFFQLALRLTIAALHDGPHPSVEMIDVLYADDADSGPENADNALSINIYRLRKRLALLGISIGRRRDNLSTMSIELTLGELAA